MADPNTPPQQGSGSTFQHILDLWIFIRDFLNSKLAAVLAGAVCAGATYAATTLPPGSKEQVAAATVAGFCAALGISHNPKPAPPPTP